MIFSQPQTRLYLHRQADLVQLSFITKVQDLSEFGTRVLRNEIKTNLNDDYFVGFLCYLEMSIDLNLMDKYNISKSEIRTSAPPPHMGSLFA